MHIRKAVLQDVEELLAIYNDEVLHGVATLDLTPKTLDEWRLWFCQHNTSHHPLLVAEHQGQVAGYACLSPYRSKEAYRSTVELSVYVGRQNRRQGVATSLMEAILQKARQDDGIHTVVSVITHGNKVSRHLHEKYGFIFCGQIREVGMKQGRYLDIDNYQLMV